jgi:hypothetical protein
MDSFSKLFKKEKMGELVLLVLIIVYLVMNKQPPELISSLVNNILGKVVLVGIVVYLFLYKNPILAVVSILVAYDLIIRSSYVDTATRVEQLLQPGCTDGPAMSQYPFTAYNQFPYTLEQEVVKKMAPIVMSGNVLTQPSFKPHLDNDHDASPINYSD